MKSIRWLMAFVLAFSIIAMVAVMSGVQSNNGGSLSQSASAAINQTNISDGIGEVVEEWIPFIVLMSFIGIGLSALGINMYMKR